MDFRSSQVKGSTDVLMTVETRFGNTIPAGHFIIIDLSLLYCLIYKFTQQWR